MPRLSLIVRAHRAYALHRAGRIEASIDAFERCIADLDRAQMRPHRAMARIRQAALRRYLGHDPAVGLAVIDAAAIASAATTTTGETTVERTTTTTTTTGDTTTTTTGDTTTGGGFCAPEDGDDACATSTKESCCDEAGGLRGG